MTGSALNPVFAKHCAKSGVLMMMLSMLWAGLGQELMCPLPVSFSQYMTLRKCLLGIPRAISAGNEQSECMAAFCEQHLLQLAELTPPLQSVKVPARNLPILWLAAIAQP